MSLALIQDSTTGRWCIVRYELDWHSEHPAVAETHDVHDQILALQAPASPVPEAPSLLAIGADPHTLLLSYFRGRGLVSEFETQPPDRWTCVVVLDPLDEHEGVALPDLSRQRASGRYVRGGAVLESVVPFLRPG